MQHVIGFLAGGEKMTSKKIITSTIAAAIVALSAGIPSFAAGAAQPTSVKFGYFNLALVKASYPEAAGSEQLRVSAENQLRADVEAGNKMLAKMQEDKKPKEEIEKAARDLQTQINAKQQALIQLVQTQSAIATQAIAQAVAQVAKDKGLDVVVDGAGVFAGGEKLVNNGEDITEAIVKKLQPQTQVKPAGNAGGK
jgi:Skp family chaperone for outer membrane proteins